MTGERDPHLALKRLREMGVTFPVVTLGPKGACFLLGESVREVSAPHIEVVDTTGAGDGFTEQCCGA